MRQENSHYIMLLKDLASVMQHIHTEKVQIKIISKQVYGKEL